MNFWGHIHSIHKTPKLTYIMPISYLSTPMDERFEQSHSTATSHPIFAAFSITQYVLNHILLLSNIPLHFTQMTGQ